MNALHKLIALLFLAAISSTAFAITDAQLFAYAEANYSKLFPGTATAGRATYQGSSYDYRFYPASKNYLAVDTGGAIFVLGSVSGNAILNVGTLTSFANTVTAWQATQDPCIGAASKWALWSSGATCLRGANVAYDIYAVPYTQADFNALSAMGANVARLFVGVGLYAETAPYALNATAQANLDKMLGMVQKANMFAIIVIATGPGRNFDPEVAPGELHSVWTNPTEQTAWVDMWRYTAARYKDNPIVVGYDLMNEPNSNSSPISPTPTSIPSDFYPPGGGGYAGTSYDWNPLAKRISDAIRQVDITTPILIESLDWGAASWLNSLTSNGDSKTVYVIHQYEPQESYTNQLAPYTNSYGTTTSSCGTTPCTFTRAVLDKQYGFVSSFRDLQKVPVGNTEFGVHRYEPGAAQFLDDEMGIMESIGVNYWIHDWEPAGLVQANPAYYMNPAYNGFNFRFGTDPNNHVDVVPNPLTTVIQKYFSKNTVRPSNRNF